MLPTRQPEEKGTPKQYVSIEIVVSILTSSSSPLAKLVKKEI